MIIYVPKHAQHYSIDFCLTLTFHNVWLLDKSEAIKWVYNIILIKWGEVYIVSLSLKGYQMIVKSVFREQLDWDNIVKVLRSRFSVKANTLTTLTVSQLTEIVAKKLLNYQFCSIKKGASFNNMKMQDIIVHKEISL